MSAPVSLARRVVERYGLSPPIDVAGIVKQHADVVYERIPVEGVDGICLNLKVIGVRPKVIIHSGNPTTRQRFTLAHELGHILIPWHTGTIVDSIDVYAISDFRDYKTYEDEANQFAAALLMPESWILKEISKHDDLAKLHKIVVRDCEVSALAAAINLQSRLPENIVYAVSKDGHVEFSGRTKGTLAGQLERGQEMPDNPFPYAASYFRSEIGARTSHWWIVPSELELDGNDPRSWRELLDEIIRDLRLSPSEARKFKMSLNGVLGAANGQVLHGGSYSLKASIAACIQRLQNRTEFPGLVEHPLFEPFVYKRCEEFAAKCR